jgi:hypothetical protein
VCPQMTQIHTDGRGAERGPESFSQEAVAKK